ncbi:lipid kinase YegS [Nitratifractor sp.]
MSVRLVLNAQKAADPDLHDTIAYVRKYHCFDLDVRLSYFPEDIERLVSDAARGRIGRIVAGGGDGTVHHVLNALMALPAPRPELAILPLGTGNDFATAAKIPLTAVEALILAVEGDPVRVDVGRCNERYFLNVASGGFGAVVTTQTPPELKELLGGGAYALTGLLNLFNFTTFEGRVRIGEFETRVSSLALGVCNGRQAGGGMRLAPEACVNDGLLDIVLFTTEPLEIPPELAPPSETIFGALPFKRSLRAPEMELIPEGELRRLNLDGEPCEADRFVFSILPRELDLVLPEDSAVLCGGRS